MLEEILKRVDIEEVDKLLPHEETIEKNLFRLKEGMLNIGQVVDPLIVDKDSGVVLDGNHRVAVLKNIGCPLAPIQPVDYSSSKIGVGTWLPVSKDLKLAEVKEKAAVEEVELLAGMKAVNEFKAPFMFVFREAGISKYYLIEPADYGFDDFVSKQLEVISQFEDRLKYIGDDFFDEKLKDGHSVFYRRPYTKKEIIKKAKDRKPFPPKSTRHIIPDRIIRLNMRIGWLHENKEQAYELMKSMLVTRAYNGNVRRYPESVIVIY
ncbi:hypothetical protein KAW38_04175 [Candidatus Micrarchaeota archaeon]|nr:hypothetical protein [Candidatus Micrarchaeota archaeon]